MEQSLKWMGVVELMRVWVMLWASSRCWCWCWAEGKDTPLLTILKRVFWEHVVVDDISCEASIHSVAEGFLQWLIISQY